MGIVIFNYALLKYYTDPHETVKLTLFIQITAFSSVMVYILLIPFDVFASVRHFDEIVHFEDPILHKTHKVTIYDLYFICYIGMIYMCFVGLPFSYFYAQSVQDEDEMGCSPTEEGSAPGMKGMDSESSEEEDMEKDNQDQDIESL